MHRLAARTASDFPFPIRCLRAHCCLFSALLLLSCRRRRRRSTRTLAGQRNHSSVREAFRAARQLLVLRIAEIKESQTGNLARSKGIANCEANVGHVRPPRWCVIYIFYCAELIIMIIILWRAFSAIITGGKRERRESISPRSKRSIVVRDREPNEQFNTCGTLQRRERGVEKSVREIVRFCSDCFSGERT